MTVIHFENRTDPATTPIHNEFIDKYLPKADGNFVKVYIFLYRCYYHQKPSLSTKDISEKLGLLESDVIKAFQYWAEQGLIHFKQNDDMITIGFQIPSDKEIKEDSPKNSVHKKVHIYHETRPNYSPEELSIYMKNPEISHLFKIAERYLGRMLNHNDLQILYSLYDWLRLPVDVIELLLEHCISNNHRSIRYIEKVAITWAEEGINTLEKAKLRIKIFNEDFREIMKTFGLNRDPAPVEIEYMNKWINELHAPMEIILEACKRTITQIQEPKFSYAHTIIDSWNKNGVKSLEDIKKLDAAYLQKKNLQNNSSNTNDYYSKPSKFVNFKQREWDFEELERLEREYLQKELSKEDDCSEIKKNFF
ncbi:MAG: DnaD domain protein [Epulopiscium sp.]|nr:DnaD domain protein [Candidatus Epulonipiscium sp.]